MINLSIESLITMEVRRLFGAGRCLVKANNNVINKLKSACFTNEYDIAAIEALAHSDAAVMSKIIEVANRTIRYKSVDPITKPNACITRIGQKGMQAVALAIEIESLSMDLNPFWKRVFSKIELNTRKALVKAVEIRAHNENTCSLYEVTNKTLLLSLSCYAKAVACSSIKANVDKITLNYILTPNSAMAELIQSAMGVRVEVLDFSEGDTSNSASIALKAWSYVTSEIKPLNVSNLKFKPRATL